MRNPFVVKKGIYIDMGCAGIRNVEEGIFIPTGYHTSESLPKFQEDLAAFLKKWFPNEGGDTKMMSGIHLAIPVFSKGYRPKQGKVAP